MDRLPVVPPHSPKFRVPQQVVRLGALRWSVPVEPTHQFYLFGYL